VALVLSSLADYERALEELAQVQQAPPGDPAHRRRRELEAATQDYAQRLKGAELEKGRPERWQDPSGPGKP
jgi:hypothetical protein